MKLHSHAVAVLLQRSWALVVHNCGMYWYPSANYQLSFFAMSKIWSSSRLSHCFRVCLCLVTKSDFYKGEPNCTLICFFFLFWVLIKYRENLKNVADLKRILIIGHFFFFSISNECLSFAIFFTLSFPTKTPNHCRFSPISLMPFLQLYLPRHEGLLMVKLSSDTLEIFLHKLTKSVQIGSGFNPGLKMNWKLQTWTPPWQLPQRPSCRLHFIEAALFH